ncbi:MAG TPA: glycosyltransferase family 39 protein [Bacteroidia bacterium]|nr:glycosyltransferase family 39 protein [Bacteroidia bacterium]
MPDKKNLPFFIFAIAVFIALLVPSLVQDGMFMDGILYTVASKNLANGIGTWWNLHINNFMHSVFCEQPPLTFWIQSFFFRVFGDSIYTERIYSFVTACISGCLIIKIWNLIYEDKQEISKISWLPFLFWIIPPVCFWTYANDMEECTMSIFILLAAWFILKGFKSKIPVPFLIAGSFCIFLSSFCKGIQGMFPLAIAGIHWIVYRQFSFGKMLLYTFILLAVPAGIYFLLLQKESSYQFLKAYYDSRLYNAFTSPGVYTTDNHFEILIRLMNELLIPAAVCIIMIIIFRKKSLPRGATKPSWKIILLFLLIGLSGSLPLMVTLEQRRFYLVPSLPFFAIAFAAVIAPGISLLLQQMHINGKFYTVFKKISAGLVAGAIIFSITQIGNTRRDREMLHDVYAIGKIIPPGSDINMHPSFFDNWSLQLYFTRHFNISLNPNPEMNFLYLILPDTAKPDLQKYSDVHLDLKKYRLYKLSN